MRSRREFLQMAAVSAGYFAAIPNFARAAAQQRLSITKRTILTNSKTKSAPIYHQPSRLCGLSCGNGKGLDKKWG